MKTRRSLPILFTILSLLLAHSNTAVAAEASEAQIKALEAKYRTLELRVRKLEAAAARTPATASSAQGKAVALLRDARREIAAGNVEAGNQLLSEIKTKYPATKAGRHALQFQKEVDVLGMDADELRVEKWFSGDAAMNDGDLTILVFWEAWCPHCKREVPKLEALYQRYRDQGLNLIGLTKVTKSATDEKVEAFIRQHGITYPTAKEQNGVMSREYAVSGVPAAAAVIDGKVVWRGHPSALQDSRIEKWLAEGRK